MATQRRIPEPADRVRAVLIERGAPEHVVKGGVDGLVRAWERTALELERGYDDSLDELLNDLDGRQMLSELLELVSNAATPEQSARIEVADKRVRSNVTISDDCLWGAENARKRRWTKKRNWWYFARPMQPGLELARELGTR